MKEPVGVDRLRRDEQLLSDLSRAEAPRTLRTLNPQVLGRAMSYVPIVTPTPSPRTRELADLLVRAIEAYLVTLGGLMALLLGVSVFLRQSGSLVDIPLNVPIIGLGIVTIALAVIRARRGLRRA